VIATVYELADLSVTVIPVKSQTGPITSTICRQLWAIQAWYAEMENSEKSEPSKLGKRERGQTESIWDGRDESLTEVKRSGSAIRNASPGSKSPAEPAWESGPWSNLIATSEADHRARTAIYP
jgi:hypothetical protein